jgi:hypothetical protein
LDNPSFYHDPQAEACTEGSDSETHSLTEGVELIVGEGKKQAQEQAHKPHAKERPTPKNNDIRYPQCW